MAARTVYARGMPGEVPANPVIVTVSSNPQVAHLAFDPLDLSGYRELRFSYFLVVAGPNDGNTLDIYVRSRDNTGIWDDRVHFPQIAASAVINSSASQILRSDQELDPAEQQFVPSSAPGGARLPAGTWKDGAFPPRYRNTGNIVQGVTLVSGTGTLNGWEWELDFAGTGTGTWTLGLLCQAQVETS